MTIEELAQATGMSVRNIRNHQSRGLLQPPEVRARTGYYGESHVERLRLIQEMQAEGFKLTAIKRLLGDEGAWAERFVGLRRAISAPWETEKAEILSIAELEQRFGPAEQNVKPMQKAQKLGILIPVDESSFEAPSPALIRAAEDVVNLGVPLEAAIDSIEKLQRNVEESAKAFVDLFMRELWEPFDAEGRPVERWPEITGAIERLRPIASDVLLAMFRQTMASEVEDAFGKMIAEHGGKRRRDD